MASTSRKAAATKRILKPSMTLKGHKLQVDSISYFPDGQRMISGSWDKTTRQWDLKAGKEIKEARDVCKKEVLAVAVSRDGRWVVTAGGDMNGHRGGLLKACEVERGITMETFEGHPRAIDLIDIAEDNTLLAGVGSSTSIWNLETGKLVSGPFECTGPMGAIRFSPDSKKLALKSDVGKFLEVWDIQSQKLDVRIGKYNGGYGTYAPMFWTNNNKSIIAAFNFSDTDSDAVDYVSADEDSIDDARTIYEFDASTLKTVRTPFRGHTFSVTSLALSFDEALLASAGEDDSIKLWDFESRQLLALFHVRNPQTLVLSPDSRQLVYTTCTEGDSGIYICDTPPDILAQTSARKQSVYVGLPPPLTSFGRQSAESGSWTDRRTGAFRIQPTVTRPLNGMWQWPADTQSSSAEMWGQHYELGFQPLHQDTLHSNAGPTADLPSAHISPPPPSSQILSSTVGSQLSQLRPNHHELLPSSSRSHTVFSSRNDEPHDLPPEAILPNLTGYITKDEDYPTARGGFGEIWKCTYHIDRRSIKVAVKALQAYTTDQRGAAKAKKIKRIKRELRICANLDHPNILRVFGYTNGFGPFVAIVTPWAKNGNLTVYLERKGAALTLVRRFQLLRDIIAGLQYLHANSVIHGDFTGPNVLIHGDGTACVADFGLSLMYSKFISASQASWTSTLKGNMRWMAPELLVEREDGSQVRPSKQSDMYSFGGIMLQVLTNKVPYYHLTNDVAIVLCIAKSQTPSRSRYLELAEQYWKFIEQCWSTHPQDRPSTEGAETAIRNEFYSLSRPS